MTTILVCVFLRSNLEWMSILKLMPQTPIADHHKAERDKALDREDGSQLLAIQSAKNDAIVIKRVHDMGTDTSAETRKPEGKLDALVKLVTQLVVNRCLPLVARVSASVLPITTILVILRLMVHTPIVDHHTNRDKALDREDGS
ncbi:hypothetical protein Fmac_032880 [Flemingia macrophylla]|uniref:Uncharacterized protein n=1 Tax=Flemingia macrophylla TaxID=520843 RepID=A0ABD1L675_9FABA